jgi:hypothetical protein
MGRMAAETIRVLLHLYDERKWLVSLAHAVAAESAPAIMREIVRRQVQVDALIAHIEATGEVPTSREG